MDKQTKLKKGSLMLLIRMIEEIRHDVSETKGLELTNRKIIPKIQDTVKFIKGLNKTFKNIVHEKEITQLNNLVSLVNSKEFKKFPEKILDKNIIPIERFFKQIIKTLK